MYDYSWLAAYNRISIQLQPQSTELLKTRWIALSHAIRLSTVDNTIAFRGMIIA